MRMVSVGNTPTLSGCSGCARGFLVQWLGAL